MTRTLFALAVAAAFAMTGTAADTPAAAPAPTTAPVVTGTTAPLMTTYAPTTSARRGLFGRLRGRSASTVMSSTPAYTTTGPVVTPPPATAVPAPMPTPAPTPKTTGAATGTNPVVVAGGKAPMTAEKVTPAAGNTMSMTTATATEMAPMPVSTSTAKRMGLIARMRARR